MDKNTIKNYLKRTLELERNKLELEQTLSKINKKYVPKIKEMNKTKANPKIQVGCGPFAVGAFIVFLIFAFTSPFGPEISDELLFFVILPLLMALGGAICYGITSFVLSESNYKEIAKSNAEIAKENEKIKQQNEKNTIVANKKNKMIALSKTEIKFAIKNTQTELDILYASNFIHPKYRNLVAVATMYEYIDTGRCNSLEGTDGAYNLFELEVRLDKIIAKLDVIIHNLEQIRSNQYYLYEAINNIQPQINKISDAIIENTNKLNEVAVNTAVTAYTAQVIERNQYYGRSWDDNRGVYNDRINMPKM